MPVPVRVAGAIERVEFTGNGARLKNVSLADLQIDPFLQILRHLPSLPTCSEQQAEDAADPTD